MKRVQLNQLIGLLLILFGISGCEVTGHVVVNPSSLPSGAPSASPLPSPSLVPSDRPSPVVSVLPSPQVSPVPSPSPSPLPSVAPPAGFTALKLGRALYVSNLGKDSNPGTEALPLKTIAAGLAKVNQAQADSVLLARGETFTLPGELTLTRSGTSAQKLIVSAYGKGERPVITPYGFNLRSTVSHVAFTGLHLVGTQAVNDFGIRYVGQAGDDFLIEDMEIDGPFFDSIGFDVQGPQSYTNLQIRRNVIHDAWAKDTNQFAQCVYVANVKGLTLYQNVFDHCGYAGPKNDQANMFNHALYAQTTTTGITAQGNIVTRNQDAWQMREGGIANQNFFDSNAIHLTMRQADGVISNNVMLHAGDINATIFRGIGIYLDTTMAQAVTNQLSISNNRMAFYESAKPYGMAIKADTNPSPMTITLNHWIGYPTGILTTGSPHITQSGNSAVTAFKDIRDYMASIGTPGDLSVFVNNAKKQSSQHWDPNYTGEKVTDYFLNH